jgi:hypothetical protein
MTHGHGDSWEAAAAGAVLLHAAMRSATSIDAAGSALLHADTDRMRALLEGTDDSPPHSASHCLVIAARLVASGQPLVEILKTARSYSPGAATFAGTLWGALLGADRLAQEVNLERLEIAWVGDRLARDALREQAEQPGFWGYYGEPPEDRMWRVLYPPW